MVPAACTVPHVSHAPTCICMQTEGSGEREDASTSGAANSLAPHPVTTSGSILKHQLSEGHLSGASIGLSPPFPSSSCHIAAEDVDRLLELPHKGATVATAAMLVKQASQS